jgi:hypothetical protein
LVKSIQNKHFSKEIQVEESTEATYKRPRFKLLRHKFYTYIMVDNNTNTKGTMDITFKFEVALLANIIMLGRKRKNIFYLAPFCY